MPPITLVNNTQGPYLTNKHLNSSVCALIIMGFEKFAASTAADFTVIEEIFRNHAGSIAKVQFKYDQKLYVLKEIVVSESKSRRLAINEVNLLQQLNHPNVIKFFGHFWDDSKRQGTTQSLFMVLEYCECGDLGKLIATRRAQGAFLDEGFVWRLFLQVRDEEV